MGVTRGKERIFLTWANHRRRYGRGIGTVPSRFLEEVPRELLTYEGDSSTGLDGFADRFDDENNGLRVGAKVRHPTFGVGLIQAIEGEGEDLKAVVMFRGGGKKTFLVRYANLISED